MPYVLLAFLALIALGLFIAGRPYVAAWCYRRFGDPDPYPPEAAEAPRDDVMAVANAAGLPKPISAGSDLDGDLPTGMLTELYEAIDAYKRGDDIEADAPKEWA